MTAAPDIARLEAALERGELIAPGDAAALLAGIRAGSVDRALGLSRTAGRDEMIRAAVGRYYPDMPSSAAADKFHTDWSRFSSSAWQREQYLQECPQRHAGTIRETFWHLLRMRDAVLSARQIRRVLAICDGQSIGPCLSSTQQELEK